MGGLCFTVKVAKSWASNILPSNFVISPMSYVRTHDSIKIWWSRENLHPTVRKLLSDQEFSTHTWYTVYLLHLCPLAFIYYGYYELTCCLSNHLLDVYRLSVMSRSVSCNTWTAMQANSHAHIHSQMLTHFFH